jgi:hypothetical protein
MGVRHIATIAIKDTMREMARNIVTMNGNATYPTPTVGGPLAPACYRVSFFAGSLEVTARLKSTDDVDLLVRVLEANRSPFEKADRLATEILTLTQVSGDTAPAAPSLGETPVAALVASNGATG